MKKAFPKRSSTFQPEDKKVRKQNLSFPDAISEESKRIPKINANQI